MECMAWALPSLPMPGMSCMSDAFILDISGPDIWVFDMSPRDFCSCAQTSESAKTASEAKARSRLLMPVSPQFPYCTNPELGWLFLQWKRVTESYGSNAFLLGWDTAKPNPSSIFDPASIPERTQSGTPMPW